MCCQCGISVSLLCVHSHLKVLHSCSTKQVLSIYPYPQVCGWSNCGALFQHYCHLHRHSHDSWKENTAANDRREIEWCHHAVLVGTTKHVSPYQHIYRIGKTVKCSHSSISYCVKYHRAAAHSLITNIIFHLLIILKPFTGTTSVSVTAYHSGFSVYPNRSTWFTTVRHDTATKTVSSNDCLSHTAILISSGLVLANNYHLSVSTAVGVGSLNRINELTGSGNWQLSDKIMILYFLIYYLICGNVRLDLYYCLIVSYFLN